MRRSRPEDISLRDAAITIVNAHGSPNGSATQFDNGLFQITVFTCRQGRGLTVNHRVGGKAVSVFCSIGRPAHRSRRSAFPAHGRPSCDGSRPRSKRPARTGGQLLSSPAASCLAVSLAPGYSQAVCTENSNSGRNPPRTGYDFDASGPLNRTRERRIFVQ